jgi:hypothetical protein
MRLMQIIGLNSLRGLFIAAAVLLFAAAPAPAEEMVNTTKDGFAIDGFDAVAYFEDGRPVKGLPEFSVNHKDVTWLFASAAHRDAFAADPGRFEPQFNGWCSYAVSEGYGAEVDFVKGWAVLDEKLYLNWDEDTKNLFVAEQTSRRPAAEENWPAVSTGMVDGSVETYRHETEGVDIVHPQDAPQ